MKNMLTKEYQKVLNSLKVKIRQAKIRAALTVNNQMLNVYWEIGNVISKQESSEGWGAKTVERLAVDLKMEFPDMQGLSPRSLRYMREFSKTYPQFLQLQNEPTISPLKTGKKGGKILQQPAAKLNESQIIQQFAPLLSWTHHQIILDKVKKMPERLFYIKKTVENGWSRNILATQIESELYDRQGKAITNFELTLPHPQSELAQETFKSSYLFEFLDINEEITERHLEKALMLHIKKFLLELGRGFAYVGNQYNLKIEKDEFFADLLFYNFHLHCFIVIELKVGEFEPEFAGKLNFYINAIDEQIKSKDDNPTIGILLCKTPNKTVIRYALKNIDAPIGVSEHKLSKALPSGLKKEMPTTEELEQQLNEEMDKLKTPSQKRLDLLKKKLAGLKKEELKTAPTFELLLKLYDNSIKLLFEKLLFRLKEFEPYFLLTNYFWYSGNKSIKSLVELGDFWKEEANLRRDAEIKFQYRFSGLRKAGVDAFDIVVQLTFRMDQYWYGFILSNYDDHEPFLRKLYTENLTKFDIQDVCEKICDQTMDRMEEQIKNINRRN